MCNYFFALLKDKKKGLSSIWLSDTKLSISFEQHIRGSNRVHLLRNSEDHTTPGKLVKNTCPTTVSRSPLKALMILDWRATFRERKPIPSIYVVLAREIITAARRRHFYTLKIVIPGHELIPLRSWRGLNATESTLDNGC